MKLIQKRILKGRREFEIIGDSLQVNLRSLGSQKALTISLHVLNPEPVRNPPFIEFRGRINNETMVSLFVDNPDAASCGQFVKALSEGIHAAYRDYTGIRSGPADGAAAANSYDEPPDFGDTVNRPVASSAISVNAESLQSSIDLLRQYLAEDDLDALIESLEGLKAEPGNAARMDDLVAAFDALGPRQGAVLTYAPYIGLLLSDDPFSF